MKQILYIPLSFFFFIIVNLSTTLYAQRDANIDCNGHNIQSDLEILKKKFIYSDDLAKLKPNRRELVKCLVYRLKPVAKPIVINNTEYDKYINQLYILNLFHALQYLTGVKQCLPLQAFYSKYADNTVVEQAEFHHMDICFFYIRMTTGTVYFAPLEIQNIIISNWHKWLDTKYESFVFPEKEIHWSFWSYNLDHWP